jgi:hypothetical protein
MIKYIHLKDLETILEFLDDKSDLHTTLKNTIEHVENSYEIAFGENAINKGYTIDEVKRTLRKFSDDALKNE